MDIRGLQILAAKAIEKPDYDAFYRRVCRWFSEKFSTPLKEVEEYEESYVLTHYYESHYHETFTLQPPENGPTPFQELKVRLLSEDLEEEFEEIEAEDDDWAKAIEEEIEKQEKKITPALDQFKDRLAETVDIISTGEDFTPPDWD